MSAAKYETQTPYISSYAILRRNDTAAFVMRANTDWMNGFFTFPSGKVEKAEHPTAAASREAKEEAGVTIKNEDLKCVHVMHFRGKEEFVYLFFEAYKWTGEPTNAEPHRHSKLAWLPVDRLGNNVLPADKQALQMIKAGVFYSELDWDK